MINKILQSSLFRSAGVYTFTNIINTSIPFLMLPVFTRYLLPSDYGIVATFQVLVGFAGPFIGLSIAGAISVKYYDKCSADLPVYITNTLLLLLCTSFFALMVTILFGGQIASLSGFPSTWIWTVVLFATGQFLVDVTLTLWQVRVKPVPYGIFQVTQSVSNVGISMVLVILMGMGWQGRLMAQIIVMTAFGLIGLYLLWKNGWLSFTWNYEYIKDAMKFGVPLIPHAFGGWIIAATDRIFINRMIGVADTGMYAVAYQITMVITFVQVSFNMAWVPWLYERLGQNNALTNVKIVKFTYVYVLANLALAALMTLMAPWFFSFYIGKRFTGSLQFIIWLAFAKAIMAMYYMTCNYIFFMKKTTLIAFSTALSACIHVVFLYALIKMNGTIGAAQASVISSIVLVGLVWFFASRSYTMPWFAWRAGVK